MLTPEQRCLLDLSIHAWSSRGSAKRVGLALNEETITETMLLDLRLNYPGHVEIIPFNKTQEAKTGADWLWSFVNDEVEISVTMLVQAKRLDDPEVRYGSIGRTIGTWVPRVRQIDRLIDRAAELAVPALYAFYNHLSDHERVPLSCGSLPPGDPAHVEGFGISLAEAEAVRAVLPDERFEAHCSHSIPLHCLLCTRGAGRAGDDGSPGAIVRRLLALRAGSDRENADLYALGLRQRLHPSVALALQERPRLTEGIGEIPSELAGLDGVIVLHDSQERKG